MTDRDLQAEGWVDEFGDALYRYAVSRVRDPERAEDLVQETFLAAVRNAATFDHRSAMLTWLTGILKHKIQDYFRTKWREVVATDIEADDSDNEPTSALFDRRGHWHQNKPKFWGSPGAALQEAEFLDVVGRCLEKLPRRMADVFTLREIEEVESDVICKDLGITATNFWALMHRARLRLRQCLETNWFQSERTTTES